MQARIISIQIETSDAGQIRGIVQTILGQTEATLIEPAPTPLPMMTHAASPAPAPTPPAAAPAKPATSRPRKRSEAVATAPVVKHCAKCGHSPSGKFDWRGSCPNCKAFQSWRSGPAPAQATADIPASVLQTQAQGNGEKPKVHHAPRNPFQ